MEWFELYAKAKHALRTVRSVHLVLGRWSAGTEAQLVTTKHDHPPTLLF